MAREPTKTWEPRTVSPFYGRLKAGCPGDTAMTTWLCAEVLPAAGIPRVSLRPLQDLEP